MGVLLSAGLLFVAPVAFATEYTGSLSSGLESGMSGTVNNCSILSVSHGTVAAYPSCAISCDSGYSLSGNVCNKTSGGGSGGSGGGGGSASASGASLSIGATGGSVALAAAGNSPSVKFTAPAGVFSGATTVTISKVYASSSSYVPPAPATGLFMVGGNVFQITAASGGSQITNFAKPVTLTFTYADAQIPAGVLEANLKIYYYDAVAKAWVPVPSTVNSGTNTITATVNHLTQFAIYGAKTGAATAIGAAMTQSDKLALIAQIQATLNSLIAQLKTMVADMIAQGKYVSPALMAFAPGSSTAPQTAVAGKITRGWALGQTGEEIKTIQAILAKDPAVYPEGLVTGYFGSATLAAVQKFQEKHGIAKPGDTGYGLVGPATRAKLNGM